MTFPDPRPVPTILPCADNNPISMPAPSDRGQFRPHSDSSAAFAALAMSRIAEKALQANLARLVLVIRHLGNHDVREEHMQKIESFAFSLGLMMAGLLVLATVAPVAGTVDLRQNGTEIAGLAAPRAA